MKTIISKRDLLSDRYKRIYGEDWLEKGENFQQYAYRINTFLCTKEAVLSTLKLNGLDMGSSLNDTLFLFDSASKKYVSKLNYEDGFIFNISSFLPIFQMNVNDLSNILDICAAPGIKSSQILLKAKDTKSKIHLTVCEKDYKRFQNMKTLINNLGLDDENLNEINIDSRRLNNSVYYDEILCDVPCSAEAEMIQEKNYSRWNSKLINSYTNTQKSILAKAISLAEKNGRIIYSTCTLSPEENEEVINWAIQKFEIELEDVKLPDFGKFSPKVVKGILEWGIKKYDKSLAKTIRVVPNDIYEGFFVAVIRKK